ncbi:MAG: hypothetical protein ACYTGC_07245 [Planctomycetota bacterium]|jgi:hypothetical protein
MSTTTVNVPVTDRSSVGGPSVASLIPFDKICEPGAYICQWSGHLLRVPPDSVCSGGGPTLSIVGPEPLFVVKISENPYETLTKARLLACNLDINVCF